MFGVQAGVLYAWGPGGLSSCTLGDTCALGLVPYGMPFSETGFGGNEPPPNLVLDPGGGVYAYAQYMPPLPNVGLDTPAILGILHAPN